MIRICEKCHVYFEGFTTYLYKYDENEVQMHECCCKVKDARSILLEKIKLVSEDVNLSSMKKMREYYTFYIYHIKKIKYTANTSCFHRHRCENQFKRSFCEEIVCGKKYCVYV